MGFKKIYNDLVDYLTDAPASPPKSKEVAMANTETVETPRPKVVISDVNIEVPEQMIQAAAMQCGMDSNFARVLNAGNAFKAANLTPVYLTNQSQTALRVVPYEYHATPNILN